MSEIDSIKHKTAKRAHIPSREEAGFEDASPTVQGKKANEYPLNPVVHRGQDPELFWLNKYGNDDREELLRVFQYILTLAQRERVAAGRVRGPYNWKSRASTFTIRSRM